MPQNLKISLRNLLCNRSIEFFRFNFIYLMGRYSSGQRGQTVNLLASAFVGSNPTRPTLFKNIKELLPNLVLGNSSIKQNMSQDNMIKFECTECKRINYFSRKNKKTLKERLQLKKYCKYCKKHTLHKETK